jgi:hypothetical protein
MSNPRFPFSYIAIIVLAVGACQSAAAGSNVADDPGEPDAALPLGPDGEDSPDAPAKHHPPRDSGTTDGSTMPADARPPGDAAPADSGGQTGSDAGVQGVVSCYLEGYPTTTCSLPTHCCFTNYSSQHDGECSTSACQWGTIECDGPEDCAGGQHCCAHAIMDSDNINVGYRLACQASACGAAPINQELCHPTSSAAGTCPSGKTCVPALGNDNDLPRTLSICR